MSSSEMSSIRRSSSAVRRVRRVSHDRLPFIPYGLLPLIGLLLLLFYGVTSFAKNRIEANVERTAKVALAEINANWAEVEANGQTVRLSGVAPSEAAARRAVQTVKEARAPTAFGRARPVTRVEADFSRTGATGGPSGPQTTEPDPSTSGVAAAPAPEFTYRLADGTFTLEGQVADEATRRRIRDAARARLDPPRISSLDNQLRVTNVRGDAEYTTVALRAVNALAQCDRGTVGFVDEQLSISCELPEEVASTVRTAMEAPLPIGTLGDVSLLANEAVAACETRLDDILNITKIEFAPSSSVISPASEPILDFVAAAARECPGRLRIEGHTDNTGAPELNDRLSRERAEAVRRALIARGVESARLVSEGFGPRVPVATNATAEGRARNRRIEIRVIRN